MPKLSALANKTIIYLPIKGGGTVPAVKLSDNHYGKGETDVILGTSLSGVELRSSREQTYAGCAVDVFLQAYMLTFSEELQKSTVPVLLTEENNSFGRSIFLPSFTEWGRSGVTAPDEIVGAVPSGDGTLISTLKAVYTEILASRVPVNPSTGNPFTVGLTLRNIVNQRYYYSPSGQDSYNYNGGYGLISAGTVGWSTGAFYTRSAGITVPGNIVPIITLDSNIEVASSNGGAITKTTAVESYRKIDGVWYRTT